MAGGFWTYEKLKDRLDEILDPPDESALVSCAYELSVGSEAFVTGEKSVKQLLGDSDTVIIPPGQVALIITKETITAPPDAVGLLSFKSNFKLRGLINVSGFHVDPGFKGKLVFSMYNAGVQTIHLSVGSRLFMLWFCSLDGETKKSYDGVHQGQDHLPDETITNLAARMPSPFTLEKDLEALRYELRSEIEKTNRVMAIFVTLALASFTTTTFRSCSQPLPLPPQSAVVPSSTTAPIPVAPLLVSPRPLPPAPGPAVNPTP